MSGIDLFSDDRRHPRATGRRGPPPHRGRRRRGRRRRRARGGGVVVPLLAIAVLVGFVGGGGLVGYRYLSGYFRPPDYRGAGDGRVVVQIKPGQSATGIAQTLYELQVVKSTRAFVKAAKADTRSTSIQPGFYQMRRHMGAAAALATLLDPRSRIQAKVTIPEGWRLTKILDTLATESGIPRKDFDMALKSVTELGLPAYARGRVEGYLFPATYEIQPNTTARDLIKQMVGQFQQVATKLDLEARARQVNLDPAEVVIVASLIQAEAGQHSDMPKIARVIYNRLKKNDKLQLDSTVMYALNKYGIIATSQDLQARSPYNTYARPGLPPGPIDSPGEAAIEAALHPAQGDWYWFVTTDPKRHITEFATTYAQFEELRKKLYKNLGTG